MSELFRRAKALNPQADCDWKILFEETFKDEASLDEALGASIDDMVFYVEHITEDVNRSPKSLLSTFISQQPTEDSVVVLRRTEDHQLPSPTSSFIKWRETFYLNLISNCKFALTVCTYTQRQPPALQDQVSRRVYASPCSTQMQDKESGYASSYPDIYFTVEDFDVVFSGLMVHQPLGALTVELLMQLPNTSSKNEPKGVTIFSGAVGYDKLAQSYQRKQNKLIPSKVEYINMWGPGKKGVCQVAVSEPDVVQEVVTATDVLKRAWNQFRSKEPVDAPPTTLRTCITFIHVHWESIVKDIETSIKQQQSRSSSPA